ncbi:hypothetical protein JRO89_XS12G0184500 [Xanthoceras sorbifolium]|uniref:Uncharacterized protein n=1 Tax=Xanthoceras sorbifolium TaxID=99658 RepID=A0ABQ8HD00_9ROSI|nr:hypothetical protein JRO89_XS12G0184500 [Xanthoceras sorbifolium]
MAKEKRRDELAESLNNLLRSMSSMGMNNSLELLEKMNMKVDEQYKGLRDLSSVLRVFVDQLKSKSSGHMAKEEGQVELAESLNGALLPRRPCLSSSLPVAVLSGRRPCRSPREPAGSCLLPRLSPLAPATFFLAGRRAAYLRSSSSPVAAAPLI